MLIMMFSILTLSAQSFVINGNDYTTTSSRSSNYVETPYTYKGDKIYINKTNGRCVVYKISKTSGKKYSQAIPEDIAKDVCRKMNIAYTYVPKKRN